MNEPRARSPKATARPSALEERLASAALLRDVPPHGAGWSSRTRRAGWSPSSRSRSSGPVGSGVLTATWYPAAGRSAKRAAWSCCCTPGSPGGSPISTGAVGSRRCAPPATPPWPSISRASAAAARAPASWTATSRTPWSTCAGGPRVGRSTSGGSARGGYWAHPVLSRVDGVSGAMFEDVSSHLIKWSWRRLPLKRPLYVFFLVFFRRAFRYLDLRRHAPALRVKRHRLRRRREGSRRPRRRDPRARPARRREDA